MLVIIKAYDLCRKTLWFLLDILELPHLDCDSSHANIWDKWKHNIQDGLKPLAIPTASCEETKIQKLYMIT